MDNVTRDTKEVDAVLVFILVLISIYFAIEHRAILAAIFGVLSFGAALCAISSFVKYCNSQKKYSQKLQ